SNLITTFTGLWLAFMFTEKHFLQSLDIVILTLVGSAFIIAGSCALNNFIDRNNEPIMQRTKGRTNVTGKISGSKVLIIGFTLVGLGLLMLFLTNIVTGVIGIIGVLSYVVLYSMWSKRRHVSNTIVGSISGAIPPLIGWAAVEPALGMGAWALFLIMFVWQPPHFYALAMKRTEEYRAAGIPMLPVVKGFHRTKKSMLAWVLLLFPLPFLLMDLGIGFIILAALLNVGWLTLAIK